MSRGDEMTKYQVREKGIAGDCYFYAKTPAEALENYLLFWPSANPNDVQVILLQDAKG